jgi:hypothetical protein
MNERVIELYKQAAEFAYKTAGADAGKGTIIESLTAEKFAELIIKECAEIARVFSVEGVEYDGGDAIREHFGVER